MVSSTVALKHISSLVHHFLDFFFSLPFFSLLFFAAGLSPRSVLELGERLLDVGRDAFALLLLCVFLLHLVRSVGVRIVHARVFADVKVTALERGARFVKGVVTRRHGAVAELLSLHTKKPSMLCTCG